MVPKTLSEAYYSRKPKPQSDVIWESDWDLLVVLDACRPEWLQSVQDEFDFLDTIDDTWSVGSHSQEWIENTFSEENCDFYSETAYVTGNHFANEYLHPD